MCLITDGKKLTAEEDIICYKMLKREKNGFRTPFYCAKVVLGNTYESELVYNYGNVSQGLHSFKYKNETVNYVKEFSCHMIVVKCIIPKGSEYYEGMFESGLIGGSLQSFASNKIKYTEIIYEPQR